MGTSKLLWGQPDKMLGDNNLRWTSIPSRGSRNTPSRFMLQKPEISAGTDEPFARTISIGAVYYYPIEKDSLFLNFKPQWGSESNSSFTGQISITSTHCRYKKCMAIMTESLYLNICDYMVNSFLLALPSLLKCHCRFRFRRELTKCHNRGVLGLCCGV